MDSKERENTAGAVSALQGIAERIRRIEVQARQALSADDTQEHRQKLEEKTTLLMGLPETVEPFLDGMPGEVRAEVKAGVNGFARRATQAWELSSIFYMSALLYPDDYREGQPNDLEAFIEQLRSKYLP